jgi:hypothetical protein
MIAPLAQALEQGRRFRMHAVNRGGSASGVREPTKREASPAGIIRSGRESSRGARRVITPADDAPRNPQALHLWHGSCHRLEPRSRRSVVPQSVPQETQSTLASVASTCAPVPFGCVFPRRRLLGSMGSRRVMCHRVRRASRGFDTDGQPFGNGRILGLDEPWWSNATERHAAKRA